jgi:hypothetical protein
MQVNLAANHPVFKDLGVVGYWGSYYGDEELYRWSMRLLRHYCIEGNSSMLSERYGYKYNPGHLRNCDFNEGLSHWQIFSPVEGSVIASSYPNYGKVEQARWGAADKTGDNFCLLKRQPDAANVVSQVAVGLIPGRVYSLQFVTVDYQDLLKQRRNSKKHPVTVETDSGVTLIPEKSYVHVDNRKDKGRARINLHHLRFRANAERASLSFTDEAAAVGEQYALNYIMLKPYYVSDDHSDASHKKD